MPLSGYLGIAAALIVIGWMVWMWTKKDNTPLKKP